MPVFEDAVDAIGTHANAWNNVAVLANGLSNTVAIPLQTIVSVFGNTSGNSNLNIQVSQDGTNFYNLQVLAITTGNFGTAFICSALFVRLQSTAARTITATIAAK